MKFKKVISSLAAAAVMGSMLAAVPAGAADVTTTTVYKPYSDNLINNSDKTTEGSKILEEKRQADWTDGQEKAYVYIGNVDCTDIRSVTIGYGFDSTASNQSSVPSTANFYATESAVTAKEDIPTAIANTTNTKKFASATTAKNDRWSAVYYKLGLDNDSNPVLTSISHNTNKLTGEAKDISFSIPEAGTGVIVEIPLVNGEVYIDNIQLETALDDDSLLKYGTDYTCAAYFSEGKLVTNTAGFDPTTDSGVSLTRTDSTESKCLAYMVLDISGVSVKGASWDANDSVRIYTTDNDTITKTAPKDMDASQFDLKDNDWTQNSSSNALYNNNGLKQVYGLDVVGACQFGDATSGNAAASFDISGKKYLVISFNKWNAPSTFANFKLYGESEKALTVNGTPGTWADAKAVIEDAVTETVNIVLNENVTVDTQLFNISSENGTSKTININAAEGKNITLTSTYSKKEIMASDASNASVKREINIGTTDGSLTINGSVNDNAMIMIAKATKMTLGANLKLTGNAKYIFKGWDGTTELIADNADLSKLTLSGLLVDDGDKNTKLDTKLTLKGDVKLPNYAFNVKNDTCELDISAYTGAPITITVDSNELAAGKVVAIGGSDKLDKLSFTNDSFVLAAGTGENDGKIVLAAKSKDIEATPLDNNFDDGSMGWTAALTVEEGKTVDLTNPKWIISNKEAKTTSVDASVSEEINTTVTGGSYVFGLVLTETAIGKNTIDKVWFSY